MKKSFKTIFFTIITLVLTFSGTDGSSILIELNLKYSLTLNIDTTVMLNLLKTDTFKLKIVPPSSGVQFYKDRIVFLSMSKYEKIMSPDQISFGTTEAYYASVEDSAVGVHKVFSPLSSFPFPCEAMTFNNDYDTVYFTKIPKRDKKEKIFMGRFTSVNNNQTGLVTESNPLDFCTEKASYSHPALSADGNMMIYASDKTGSNGGMDLFISRKIGDKWSSPQNLGKPINTSGNEFFPFLDSQNNLYFSSDGLPGYGGYDIFTCKFNGTDWGKPMNLTDRINSVDDDIAFTINRSDSKTAFFSRRSTSGNRDIQLFRIKLKQKTANQNQLTLSEIFNGKPGLNANLTAFLPAKKEKNLEAEIFRTKPEHETLKKEEIKIPEKHITPKRIPDNETVTRPDSAVSSPVYKPVSKPETKQETKPEAKPEIKPEVKTVSAELNDGVIYRVQILPSTSQIKAGEMVINGETYKIFAYTYLGAVRYTVGEFRTLAPAVTLQRICRQSGISQSFVAAFKNGSRSLDTNLFK
jgi:hypothetical protein